MNILTHAEVFWSCLAIVSAVMVGGLFLRPALRYGTGYQTVWEIWPSAETPSSIHWRRFYFQLTRVHSALELSGRCALQIYLLTDTMMVLYLWKATVFQHPTLRRCAWYSCRLSPRHGDAAAAAADWEYHSLTAGGTRRPCVLIPDKSTVTSTQWLPVSLNRYH